MRLLILALLILTSNVKLDEHKIDPEEFDPNDFTYWVEYEDALSDRSSIKISKGPHKPNDEVYINFTPGSATYHYKLVRVDVDPYVVYEETSNTTFWNVTLPEFIPAVYRIGVAISGNSRIHLSHTYLYLQTIVVGHESQINASLTLKKQSFECDEDIVYIITNYGPHDFIGLDYTVDKFVNDEWQNVQVKGMFTLKAPIICPGKNFSEKIDMSYRFSYLDEGLYRINKRVSCDYLGVSKTFSSEFTVPQSPRIFWVKLKYSIQRGVIFTIMFMLPLLVFTIILIRRRRSPLSYARGRV